MQTEEIAQLAMDLDATYQETSALDDSGINVRFCTPSSNVLKEAFQKIVESIDKGFFAFSKHRKQHPESVQKEPGVGGRRRSSFSS